MKTLIATMALAIAVASPAVAATAHSHGKSHVAAKHTMKHVKQMRTVRHVRPSYQAGYVQGPYQGYGQERPQAYSRFGYHPSYDAYVNGNYAGTDPDPLIRMQLKREYCQDSMDGCLY